MIGAVSLRAVEDSDLAVFFDNQSDPAAVEMAAFPARDKDQFDAHWARLRADPNVINRTIVADGVVVGQIGRWTQDGQLLVGYGIGRAHWGSGIMSRALAQFLADELARPVYAHVAAHNVGSARVLQKCGFRRDLDQEAGEPEPEDGIEEFIFVLDK